MFDLPPSIEPLFRSAGWQSTGRPTALPSLTSAQEICDAIIAEFGGLTVGVVDAGRDLAASDVRFYSGSLPEDAVSLKPWRRQLDSVAAVASAHHDHMIVFVDAGGRFLVFTEPDGSLYLIGRTFGEAMERLLLGLDYGKPIPKDT